MTACRPAAGACRSRRRLVTFSAGSAAAAAVDDGEAAGVEGEVAASMTKHRVRRDKSFLAPLPAAVAAVQEVQADEEANGSDEENQRLPRLGVACC